MDVHVLSIQDCMDLIASNSALAQHGLTQPLQEVFQAALEDAAAELPEASYSLVACFQGIDASLQYAWDAFTDTFAASKQPLTQVADCFIQSQPSSSGSAHSY